MLMWPTAAALPHQARAGEQISGGAHRRPHSFSELRMPWREPVEEFARAPIGVRPPRGAQQVRDHQ
jgi:hypothetical protein